MCRRQRSNTLVSLPTSFSSWCFVDVPSAAPFATLLTRSQSGSSTIGKASRTGGGIIIEELNFNFDTKKLALEEVASDPTIMRIRLDGVNRAGSRLASM